MSPLVPTHPVPPRVLTIAGSDSGGGAGIQADLKTFAAHKVFGMSAISAITAQNTVEVRSVHEVPEEVVADQIDAVFEDLGVDAVKIGMLSSAGIIGVVADRLRHHRPAWVVLDPVMVAKSGDALLREDAVQALIDELLPLATVVTPNLPEAARLLGRNGSLAEEERESSAQRLAEAGPAVLLKGGHGEGDVVEDLLVVDGDVLRFRHPRVHTRSTHGTGCTLSSAVAARVAGGASLRDAVAGAIDYLQGALRAAYPLGSGQGPVNHLWNLKVRAGDA